MGPVPVQLSGCDQGQGAGGMAGGRGSMYGYMTYSDFEQDVLTEILQQRIIDLCMCCLL